MRVPAIVFLTAQPVMASRFATPWHFCKQTVLPASGRLTDCERRVDVRSR